MTPLWIAVICYLVLVMTVAELWCPFTKVEESFHMQAVHDFYYATDTDAFDHHLFPGVVPRSFVVSWALAFAGTSCLVVWEQVVRLALFLLRGMQCETRRFSFLDAGYFSFLGENQRAKRFLSGDALSTDGRQCGSDAAAVVQRLLSEDPMVLSHATRLLLGLAVVLALVYVASGMTTFSGRRHSASERPRKGHQRSRKTTCSPPSGPSANPQHGTASLCFLMLCAGQFHLVFYSTRTLPNTPALVASTLALGCVLRSRWNLAVAVLTVGAATLRCDLALLVGTLGLYGILHPSLQPSSPATPSSRCSTAVRTSFSFPRALFAGLTALLSAVVVTVPLDSVLWQPRSASLVPLRLLWPEMVVLWFNTYENQSSAWGILPPQWYFSKALPRAFLAWTPIVYALMLLSVVEDVRLGCALLSRVRRRRTAVHQRSDVGPEPQGWWSLTRGVSQRYHAILTPATWYILLYSALPHKEIRFLLPVFPWLLVPLGDWVATQAAFSLPSVASCSPTSLPRIPSSADLRLRIWQCVTRLMLLMLFVVSLGVTMVFVYISEGNYTGSDGLLTAHQTLVHNICNEVSESVALPPPLRQVIFLDAYATMTGINKFQKRFHAWHAAALPPNCAAAHSTTPQPRVGASPSVLDRWQRLAVLPFATARHLVQQWRSPTPAPGWVYNLTSSPENTWQFPSLVVDYRKEPDRFVMSEESADASVRYNATGIDYALLRVSQREFHLSGRGRKMEGQTPEFKLVAAFPVRSSARVHQWVRYVTVSVHQVLTRVWYAVEDPMPGAGCLRKAVGRAKDRLELWIDRERAAEQEAWTSAYLLLLQRA